MKRPAVLVIALCLAAAAAARAGQRAALTPPPGEAAHVNGAEVYGVRPGHPFLYRIPATGRRPLTFFARRLPRGLTLDTDTGIIAGKVTRRGVYDVTLGARNGSGSSERAFRIVVGDQLALTPPMGWSTWYMAFTNIGDTMVRTQTRALISTGLADHGYSYVEIDDGWNRKPADEPTRNDAGALEPSDAFPDMKGLTDHLHSLGLKAGIYSSPGPQTCGKFAGSESHEAQDAETFAAWGFDLLKYDLCSYEAKFLTGPHDPAVRIPYERMGRILPTLDRDVVYSMCQYGYADAWEWARGAGGNTWRTTDDLGDDRGGGLWQNVLDFGFGQAGKEAWAGAGGWNDPDNLLLGRIIWHGESGPTPLTHNEQYTHFTLWSVLAAPLVIGGDLTRLDEFTLRLLGNDEVIAVDQDPLGKQGVRVYQSGTLEVWRKDLKDGAIAVAFFNRGDAETEVPVTWSDLGIHGKRRVRDLWRQRDLGFFDQEIRMSVGEHGAELVRLQKR